MLEVSDKGIILRVRLTPNSSSCAKNGFFTTPSGEEFVKINVVSVPEKGKANAELIAFLAKTLRIAKSEIIIISGELDRYKKVLLKNADDELKAKVQNWLGRE